MSLDKLKFTLSFQAKILISVISLLILLPAVTLVIVHRNSMDSLLRESRQALRTADALFQNALDMRVRQLLARYRNIISDPRFRAVSRLVHPATMNEHLNDRLQSEEFGDDTKILLFLDKNGKVTASAAREGQIRASDFELAARPGIEQALGGEASSTVVPVGAAVFHVLAIPVVIDQELTGILAVGVRLELSTLRELTSLIHGEGALIAGQKVAASTLHPRDLHGTALARWRFNSGEDRSETELVLIDRVHYVALTSRFRGAAPTADLGYVLLLSYESALQEFKNTQATLALLSILGIGLSTLVISWVIRRITAPLRELRSSAEAVGFGDFSRKIPVRSKDEIGQLADAFNHMTENLTASRSELEKALETLKTTQAQLVQSEKLSAVGEFVSGIAHELNNPLTCVIGYGELLKQADLQATHRKYLDNITKSTHRCHKIVHGLLSFARQRPPERKMFKVDEMIETVLELLAYEMRTGNVEVQCEFQRDLPSLLGDEHQLQQVILNLLNNARQAIEEHQPSGRIRIAAEHLGDRVRITIEDNGPGISAADLRKIFDPFFTTKPVGKGTGLGLSLCYGIVREHGGVITAGSSPGKGATFIIELPACQGSDPKVTIPLGGGTELAQKLNGTGKRALVVDDEESILDLVRHILKQDGFEVDIAPNGGAALQQVARNPYELLLCDWKMPGLSGVQLYERIREISPESARRVIFMTGDIASESLQQFLRRNDKSCLSKPFSTDEFRQTISHFISGRN